MDIVLQIQIATLGAVIFSAGVIWNKVIQIEKKIGRVDEHSRKISVLETEVKNIKSML